jgi:hypothetical protein
VAAQICFLGRPPCHARGARLARRAFARASEAVPLTGTSRAPGSFEHDLNGVKRRRAVVG